MHRALDATAVGLSTLCIAHCLLLPLAAAALPLAGQFAEAEWVHWAIMALATPAAIVAIAPALAERPIPWAIPILAGLGLSALTGALFAPNQWEAVLSVAGGLVLASAHILNWRHAHQRSHAGRHQ